MGIRQQTWCFADHVTTTQLVSTSQSVSQTIGRHSGVKGQVTRNGGNLMPRLQPVLVERKWVLPEAAYFPSMQCTIRLIGFVDKEVIDVALVATTPTPLAATVGGEIGATWWTQNMSGLFRDACDPNGSYNYTPLYMLKKIRRKGLLRRESPVPDPEDDDLWVFKTDCPQFITTLNYCSFIPTQVGRYPGAVGSTR